MSEILLQSIQGVLVIIIMVAVGYYLASRHWFNEDSKKLLAKLVTQVALPPYMLTSITKDFTKAELFKLLPNLWYPVLSMFILMGLAWLIVRLIHVNPRHQGLFTSMFFNSNTVFVGLPINLAIFGERSLPYVLVYYMANTTIFWTLGVYFIQRDQQRQTKISLKSTLQKIFSAPLLGFMIGIVLIVLNIHLPSFLSSSFTYLGGLTIPLSMLFIGVSVYDAGLRNMRFQKDNLGVLLGRFVFAPSLMALLVMPSSMPLIMKQVFILQSCMPVMTNAPVVAKLYDADADFASIMVTESTLLSLIMVPVMMWIMG
ncbi:AEC family transporter [Pediococcus acidilactici]|uniref:AEC family transporter n=2 Tax=Pediococcus acidilactici TaxID=1254 RepID=UPI0009C0DF7A|nr:AEC family transporter [Pediococcus acidilactici]QHS02590.1 AEC family transporter [Pediococcus acidilactici]